MTYLKTALPDRNMSLAEVSLPAIPLCPHVLDHAMAEYMYTNRTAPCRHVTVSQFIYLIVV